MALFNATITNIQGCLIDYLIKYAVNRLKFWLDTNFIVMYQRHTLVLELLHKIKSLPIYDSTAP